MVCGVWCLVRVWYRIVKALRLYVEWPRKDVRGFRVSKHRMLEGLDVLV